MKLVFATKAPVDVPPANWMVLVVTFPAFVTDWRVGVVPAGQFVPSARQICLLFTVLSIGRRASVVA